MFKALPLGTSNFTALRLNNEIYVDKTDLIFQLALQRGKIFLARPRRFGKSLLISTFESLFKNGLKDFEGLAIEKLWKDKTYPVVRLDFSEIKEFSTAEEFKQKFDEKLIVKFSEAGFRYTCEGVGTVPQLSAWLSSLSPSSLVILIDEYDAPLTACLDKPQLFNKVRSVMSELFLTLKSNEGCQRFFFMTGITKFSNTSIFSAFNNLQDISLDVQYGTLLGYTEEEITRYFSAYIDLAKDSLGITKEKLIDRLGEQYDGFSFDRRAQTHVYCPWSVLNFFAKPAEGFQNYWYTSGGQPTVLMKYLNTHALKSPAVYNEDILVSLSELGASRQYDEISTEALLTQSGYLTIKALAGGAFVQLGYPNQEVAESMAALYAEELLKGQNIARSGIPALSRVMAQESVETVVDYFNRALSSIDYVRYPIKDESACRAYLQVLLIGAAMLPRVEVHNALGRCDMEVQAGKRHWVFEFKYTRDDSRVQSLLREASEQITNRRYGSTFNAGELIRVALVFSEKERRFVAWESV